ncbi:MAG: hypothetical protein ACLTER_20785 [Ruminococcus sp.]
MSLSLERYLPEMEPLKITADECGPYPIVGDFTMPEDVENMYISIPDAAGNQVLPQPTEIGTRLRAAETYMDMAM